MAVGNQVGKIFIWDLWSGYQNKPHHTLTHQKMLAQCRQCSFSPNGEVLIAVFDDSTVWRFDYRNYAKKRDLNGQSPYTAVNGKKEVKEEPEPEPVEPEPVEPERVKEPEIEPKKIEEPSEKMPKLDIVPKEEHNGEEPPPLEA